MTKSRKKNKQSQSQTAPGSSTLAGESPGLAAGGNTDLPPEAQGTAVVGILAAMMLLAPALGVPSEEMLQDTLKSIVVSFLALGAGLLLFWQQRKRSEAFRWHMLMWLPLALMVYALGSMAWSHTYLGAVEAIRWFVFSLLVWLGLNTLARERLPTLAWGIHAGAVVASLWAVLQFWFDFQLFPQGPHPASTFVNRNFFAEFAVCTLPFGLMLWARARKDQAVAGIGASVALVVLAILMTGTRAALIAMWVQLLLVLPWIAWRYRAQFAFPQWSRHTRLLAAAVTVGLIVGLGSIPTGDAKIVEEGRGLTALERGARRTASVSPDDHSLGVRKVMWKQTLRVIEQRPISGVGAGAWESEIPLYQDSGSQLETDYYVHNEYLQLLAEYGLVGWAFLLALAGWLLVVLRQTLQAGTTVAKSDEAVLEAPWRAILLCSLLSLFIVSNVGFPWRMAATGALFALCLGALAASQARLQQVRWWDAVRMPWRPQFSQAGTLLMLVCLALAAFISQQATVAEYKIVRATKMALSITASGEPNNPKWNKLKLEMLGLRQCPDHC